METMSWLKSFKLKRSKEIMTATLYVCYVIYVSKLFDCSKKLCVTYYFRESQYLSYLQRC